MAAKRKKVDPRWTPRLRGDTYCSPACGGGCKRRDWEHAKIAASRLAKNLGPGWKPRVWENLGWHYEVTSPGGGIKVYVGGVGYVATMADSLSHTFHTFQGTGRTSRAAVKATLKQARGSVNKTLEAIEREERAFNER